MSELISGWDYPRTDEEQCSSCGEVPATHGDLCKWCNDERKADDESDM